MEPATLLREVPAAPDPAAPAAGSDSAAETRICDRRERTWICAACKAHITHARARLEVAGAHVHTFVNPEGMIFKVACFAEASGALGVGEASAYWSWFPGYAWQVALCRRCSAHVGWTFLGPHQTFVALIIDRVVESS